MKKTLEKNHEHHHRDHHKISLILFFVGILLFLINYLLEESVLKTIFYLVGLVLSGYHVTLEGIEDTIKETKAHKKFTPNVHILMMIAAIGAVIIGDYKEATLLIIIFAGAHYLEDYATDKSKREITKLINLNPKEARLLDDKGNVTIINASEIKKGQLLKVMVGDQVPVDGMIIDGNSAFDEASITGESIPKDKTKGEQVFGSTINKTNVVIIEATNDSGQGIFDQIIKLVSQTQENTAKRAKLIKKIEPYYVNIVLLLAPILFLLGSFAFEWGTRESFLKAMIFLTVASPCALAVADVPASLSAISNLARRGVLFKGGVHLENLAEIKAVAFDKTGTLTLGVPVVTDVYYADKVSVEDLDILVAMEENANHPLAKAIIKYFSKTNAIDLEVKNLIGVGLSATYYGNEYKIGKPTSFKNSSDIVIGETKAFELQGKTVVYFSKNDEIILVIAIQDIENESAKAANIYFRQNNIDTIMITGDAENTANMIAKNIGISKVYANVLPQNKAMIIEDLKKVYGDVLMVGDGVNDAPALASASVSMAMGLGSDVAIDVADSVLTKNNLRQLIIAHKTSRKLKMIVWQNILFSLAVILTLITLNMFGKINMPIGVLMHEGSTLIVILNSLRLLKGVKLNYETLK